eukprot:5865981-Prymnesium_polylepis.1
MFQEFPLPPHLFVYAYEDVLFCNLLYETLAAELESQGLLELTFALSQQRSVPASVPFRPIRALIALADSHQVVCLEDPSTGLHPLPEGILNAAASRDDILQFARETWLSRMGPPPKGVAGSIHAKFSKAVKLHDCWLFMILGTVLHCRD